MLPWVVGRWLRASGPSMEPTVLDGSLLWASAWPYLWRAPARHDVVVIRRPGQSRLDLKRVVGLPHEQVAWLGGSIRINDAPLSEPYARCPADVPGDEPSAMTLGPEQFFLAGDSRLHSRDSRRDGPVPRRSILAKVVWVAPARPAAPA